MRFDTLAPTLVRRSERAIIWRHGGHHHVLPPPLCRRQFLQALAGGTALGAALGTGLLRPQRVDGAEPDINERGADSRHIRIPREKSFTPWRCP